jgi:Cu/Zn superoxide dismutase
MVLPCPDIVVSLNAPRPAAGPYVSMTIGSSFQSLELTLIHPVATVAVLRGDSNVSGTVTLEQASESSPTTINYEIKGNDPSAQRGMHIHQFGDNTNGCTSAGPHCEYPPSFEVSSCL